MSFRLSKNKYSVGLKESSAKYTIKINSVSTPSPYRIQSTIVQKCQQRYKAFSVSNTKYYCTGMPTTIRSALFCVYTLLGIEELTVVVDEELVAEELPIEARHVLERPAAVHGQQHLVRHDQPNGLLHGNVLVFISASHTSVAFVQQLLALVFIIFALRHSCAHSKFTNTNSLQATPHYASK